MEQLTNMESRLFFKTGHASIFVGLPECLSLFPIVGFGISLSPLRLLHLCDESAGYDSTLKFRLRISSD
jgi:hypothetical protein